MDRIKHGGALKNVKAKPSVAAMRRPALTFSCARRLSRRADRGEETDTGSNKETDDEKMVDTKSPIQGELSARPLCQPIPCRPIDSEPPCDLSWRDAISL